MEEKSRTKFAILIALILVSAVGYSFLMFPLSGTPSVGLAITGSSASSGEDNPSAVAGEFIQVELTPQTVQDIIATLTRYRSYSRSITIEFFRDGRPVGTRSAQAAVEDGWTRVDLSSSSGGEVEHTIISESEHTLYRWYGAEHTYVELSTQERAADLSQLLPTYEDVLALDREKILTADYVSYGGLACIYVEVAEDELGYQERFWISVESGLLVCAETVKGENTVYRMTALEVDSPLSNAAAHFTLPDGTQLYQSEGG